MRKLVESTFVSLDGVIENPQNWSPPYWDDEHAAYATKLLDASDALLLGRKTYEGFVEAWPSREGDFADKFNTMPKYVVSSTLQDPEWNNSTVIGADDLAALKADQEGTILVNGSRRLVDQLVEEELVDEYRLMIFPVVLGDGKQLFSDTSTTKSLQLMDSKPVGPDGVVILTYRPK